MTGGLATKHSADGKLPQDTYYNTSIITQLHTTRLSTTPWLTDHVVTCPPLLRDSSDTSPHSPG